MERKCVVLVDMKQYQPSQTLWGLPLPWSAAPLSSGAEVCICSPGQRTARSVAVQPWNQGEDHQTSDINIWVCISIQNKDSNWNVELSYHARAPHTASVRTHRHVLRSSSEEPEGSASRTPDFRSFSTSSASSRPPDLLSFPSPFAFGDSDKLLLFAEWLFFRSLTSFDILVQKWTRCFFRYFRCNNQWTP